MVSGERQREAKLALHCEFSKPPCTLAKQTDGKGPHTGFNLNHQTRLPAYVSGLLSVPKQEPEQKDMGDPGRNANCWPCLSKLCLSIIERAAPFHWPSLSSIRVSGDSPAPVFYRVVQIVLCLLSCQVQCHKQ